MLASLILSDAISHMKATNCTWSNALATAFAYNTGKLSIRQAQALWDILSNSTVYTRSFSVQVLCR